MADPVDFEGSNMVFRAPKDMENCKDLIVFQDQTQIVSCWKLSPEELAEVMETGVVWLSVVGQGTPPALVSGKSLIGFQGRASKAEPKRTLN